MKKQTTFVLIVISVLIIAGLIVVLSGNTSHSKDPFVLGVVLPLTGDGAVYGENQRHGIELAQKDLNAHGGIGGRPLKIVVEDDGTNPAKTAAAATKLITVNGADALVGGSWDFLANAIIPIVTNSKVVTFSPSAAPDTYQVKSDYFFSTYPPVSIHEPTIEKYLKSQPGDTVALMCVNNDWGKAHCDTYERAAKALNKVIVARISLPKPDGNDMQSEVTHLKSLSPAIVMTAINFSDSHSFVERAKTLGLGASIFGHEIILSENAVNPINQEALEGVTVYRLVQPSTGFTQEFKQAYGKDPAADADKAYDAVMVIAKAVQNSGDSSSDGIIKGLRMIKGYQGESGPLDFSTSNWPLTDSSFLTTFKNGSWVTN